jgi:hypothetical protein
MADIKGIVNGFKETLPGYNFQQKGTSNIFFYDCGWHLIFVEILKSGSIFSVITGINYCWSMGFNHSIRDEGIDYEDIQALISSIKNECIRINTRKEHLLKTYNDPINMLPYFKKFNDYFHQPHGYFIARIFKNKNETKYFEDELNELIESHNKPPYLGKYDKRAKNYPEFEKDILNVFKMNDNEFEMEIIKRINERRKKLKLKVLEKYF